MIFAIVSQLNKDIDVFNLAASCKALHGMIRPEDSPIWKYQFDKAYDPSSSQENIKQQYSIRRILAFDFIHHHEQLLRSRGYAKIEQRFYNHLRWLITGKTRPLEYKSIPKLKIY
jgi:hypothetical protein